jgi:hypothetical protein
MRMADGTDWTCVPDPDRISTSGLPPIRMPSWKMPAWQGILSRRAEFTKHHRSLTRRRPQRVRLSLLLVRSLWCRPSRKTWMWCAFGLPATATKTSPAERSVTIQTEHPCRMPPDYTGFWAQVPLAFLSRPGSQLPESPTNRDLLLRTRNCGVTFCKPWLGCLRPRHPR